MSETSESAKDDGEVTQSEYVGRKWVCSCGWKGAREAAYEHAEHDCREDAPSVGPRYRPDRMEEGRQVTLEEVDE